ncbi:MAG: VWA domain-containing protein [Acidobacteriota bacterium]
MLLILCHPCNPWPTQVSGQPSQQPFPISVDVDLTLLYVSVEDDEGDFVGGLSRQDFQVFEDGRSCEIKIFREGDVPLTWGLVVDKSASMMNKYQEVFGASLQFAQTRKPEDQFFVVSFNDRVYMSLSEQDPFLRNMVDLRRALIEVSMTGQTALYDALVTALEQLERGKHLKKALIAISDGGDNASRHSFDQVLEMARASEAIIYTVGIYNSANRDRNPDILKQLAGETGGFAAFPGRTSRLEEVAQEIAQNLRRQYVIGYVPLPAPDQMKYRKVRVEVEDEGLTVRTRSGYYLATDYTVDTELPACGKSPEGSC